MTSSELQRGHRLGASILAPNDKRAGVPKSKDPDHRWCEVRAGTNRRGVVADAGPLLSHDSNKPPEERC